MHKTTIIGNLTEDAQERFTKDGRSFLTYTVAVNTILGESKYTDFFSCSQKSNEKLQRYLEKGKQVYVEGGVYAESYKDKAYLKLRVRELKLLGGGNQKEANREVQPQSNDLDDLPF